MLRKLPIAGLSWIDVVLGWRMLVRYPGLTLVGVSGMTAGIAIAFGGAARWNPSARPPIATVCSPASSHAHSVSSQPAR